MFEDNDGHFSRSPKIDATTAPTEPDWVSGCRCALTPDSRATRDCPVHDNSGPRFQRGDGTLSRLRARPAASARVRAIRSEMNEIDERERERRNSRPS